MIDNNTIAVEWLVTTLAEVKFRPNMRMYALVKTLLDACLAYCAVFDSQEYVNTGIEPDLDQLLLLINPDYKPANILLSSIQISHVTAKVGDLGLDE